jgi:hypothetical protein
MGLLRDEVFEEMKHQKTFRPQRSSPMSNVVSRLIKYYHKSPDQLNGDGSCFDFNKGKKAVTENSHLDRTNSCRLILLLLAFCKPITLI